MVGATLACALGMQGFRVAVIEAHHPKPFDAQADYDLRVSAISPGSEAILRAIKAWSLIQQRRFCPYRRMHVWDSAGIGAISFDATEIGEPHLGHIIENHVIQNALIERIKTLAEVSWHCPDSLNELILKPDRVEVKLDSGLELTARLLVGADGPASRVRSLAGIALRAQSYGQQAVVANVHTELSHQYTAWQRFMTNGPLAFLPLSSEQCAVVWSTTHRKADDIVNQTDERFCEVLAEASDFRLGRILSTSARASFPLRGGQAYPYVTSRIALIGDAAHSIHPLAGQGANLGFKDIATLFEVLVYARHDIGKLRVLRRYERARKGDNILTMRVMEGFKILFGSEIYPIVWLRNTGLNLANVAPAVKREFMRYAMGLAVERSRLTSGGFSRA